MSKKIRRKTPAKAKQSGQQKRATANGGTTVERASEVLREAAGNVNPYESMARLTQTFMPFAWFRPWIAAAAAPKLDVIDRDGSVLVRAEVPGVQKGQLAVEASDVAVTIKGEVAQNATREGERYSFSETSYGAFERTVQMPADVDSTKAKATFKDGVIEVMLPKVDRSRSHHVKF